MRLIILSLLMASTICVQAQFFIPEPVVNSGPYIITDTVYMDPNGNDNNPGTYSQPVKTFSAAMQKLPYGTAGVNGGNAYGLILLKPGYYATNGFAQYANNWKSGNTYKNISIQGIGQVVIGGTPSNFGTGHLLQLMGDHIFIKNIKLRYSSGIGLLLSRYNGTLPRQRHVLIEDVTVDSVGNFSMLLKDVDTILVRNCHSLYAARPGADSLSSPCQWPSGIKFFGSKYIKIHDSEVGYTRGEGLNFHNSEYGEAFKNRLHDNGLNFYNDNSAKLSVHHNYLYNTPGIGATYWRNCPADNGPAWASDGMLIANEGACEMGNAPVFNNCQTNCSFPSESFSNVDSMFVFNNFFQNTGRAIGFWQGNTTIAGANCIRNVFIFNNTIIGTMATPGVGSTGYFNFFFSDYNILLNSFYGYLENVRVNHNIISYDTVAYPQLKPVNMTFHPITGTKDVTFDGNLWIKSHSYIGPDGEVRPNLPVSSYLFFDSLNTILPCPSHPALVKSASAIYPFLTTDYMDANRNLPTNVGALEYTTECTTSTGVMEPLAQHLILSPNPCRSCGTITIGNLPEGKYHFNIYGITGEILSSGITSGSIDGAGLTATPGILILELTGEKFRWVSKVIVTND